MSFRDSESSGYITVECSSSRSSIHKDCIMNWNETITYSDTFRLGEESDFIWERFITLNALFWQTVISNDDAAHHSVMLDFMHGSAAEFEPVLCKLREFGLRGCYVGDRYIFIYELVSQPHEAVTSACANCVVPFNISVNGRVSSPIENLGQAFISIVSPMRTRRGPDLQFRHTRSTALSSSFALEVGYGQSQKDLHQCAQHYFRADTNTVQVLWTVKLYQSNEGLRTMTLAIYWRSDFDPISYHISPREVFSFGTEELSLARAERIIEETGVNPAHLIGFGRGRPVLTDTNQWVVLVPATVLYFGVPLGTLVPEGGVYVDLFDLQEAGRERP